MHPPFKRAVISAAAILFLQGSAYAVDSASLEFATGNKTKMLRGGAQWNWDKQWFASNGSHLGGYWDATLAYWHGSAYQGIRDNSQNLVDVGLTPVFRLRNDSRKGLYAEAGIGLHMLSEIYDNNGRRFSTNFQFGDHIGAGYVLANGWDFSFKYQHYSNGGIRHPNPGINYAVLKATYMF
ncbi:MAG: acyloxyacyl hydrolase [Burkholderiales bacterium]|nr:acyloxyacyl hydrolase [Burkholderiales bacterium]